MIGAADIGYESDVSSLTVIVPVAGTLAAASIAGGVALYIKRLERWNAAELRHSEEREKAYEAYLAACDRAWHLRIKGSVDRYKHRETIPEEKIELISESINQQAVSALEDLQRYSRNYERAGPVLFRLYSQAFEGRFTKPAAFEAARAAFQELQREETGLRKQLGLVRKASLREEFKMRREVRRVNGARILTL